MRLLLVLPFILASWLGNSQPKELKYLLELSSDLKEAERPFAASFYLKEYLKKNEEKKFHKNYEHILNLIDLVGYSVFDDIAFFDSRSYPFAAMYYHSLKALIFQKKYNKVYLNFLKFPKRYREHPVFIQLYGFASYMIGEHDQAENAFKLCLQKAKKTEPPHFMSRRNYQLVIEQCRVFEARVLYKKEMYKNALVSYDKVRESSLYYPSVFIERAWANYQLNMYDEVLGLNLSYKASWLAPFYDGEIDLVSALSLMKLCRWDDVFFFLTELHKRGNRMIANVNQIEYFLEKHLEDYLANDKKILRKLSPGQKRILRRFQLNTYWERIYEQYLAVVKELNNSKTMPIDKVDGKRLGAFLTDQKKKITKEVRNHLLGELSRYRLLLYSMKERADGLELEILARYRNTIYDNENGLESLTDKKQISVEKVEGVVQNWDYNKEYWRDEVGKFKIKIPSQCEENKKEIDL